MNLLRGEFEHFDLISGYFYIFFLVVLITRNKFRPPHTLQKGEVEIFLNWKEGT